MTGDASSNAGRRRPYHAPLRQAQAELTRDRILAAARRLFAERGYAAATVEAIAARAQVSIATLYTSFGSKSQILSALVVGLKQEADVYESVGRLMAVPDAREQLFLGARVTRRFNELAWDMLDVLRAAAKGDPELVALWDEVGGARFRDQLEITRRFARAGVLKAGLDASEAADLFWALTAHDQYRLLVVERGWSADRYEEWLRDSLCQQLL